jgi:hypothetical protein
MPSLRFNDCNAYTRGWREEGRGYVPFWLVFGHNTRGFEYETVIALTNSRP